MTGEHVDTTLTIAASPATIFAILADPARHAEIDGTGWVREPLDEGPLTGVGQTFGMAMSHAKHPDRDYSMVNAVRVFSRPHTIAWEPGQYNRDGVLEFGGWIWRYDLSDTADGDSEVTLSYDWSAVQEAARQRIQFPPFSVDHLEGSLRHLARLATA